MRDIAVLDRLGTRVASGLIRPKPLTQIGSWIRKPPVESQLDVKICKELVRRQLETDGLSSRSIFIGSWQFIFRTRRKFFSNGYWPLTFSPKVFKFWVVGPIELRHYLK